MNIYISGINDRCWKTVIAAGIAAVMQSLGYKTGVYKPIQNGAIDKGKYLISSDLTFVKMLDPYITTHSTYMFTEKSINSVSLRNKNMQFSLEKIQKDYNILAQKTDILITEATGGIMTPLNNNNFSFQIPLILKLGVVFIITPGENTINAYLNELNTAKSAGIDITGVIINKFPAYSDNAELKAFPTLVEKYSDAKVLGLIRNFRTKSVKTNILFNEILNGIDFEDIFRIKIPKLNQF